MLTETQSTWARERMSAVCRDLRKVAGRAGMSLPGSKPFDDGTTFGIEGLFKFHLDEAHAVLWFQFLGGAADAMYFDPGSRAFTVRSDPSRTLDPLGFLRGRVLDTVAASGGSRISSLPPPHESVTVAIPPSRVPKI